MPKGVRGKVFIWRGGFAVTLQDLRNQPVPFSLQLDLRPYPQLKARSVTHHTLDGKAKLRSDVVKGRLVIRVVAPSSGPSALIG